MKKRIVSLVMALSLISSGIISDVELVYAQENQKYENETVNEEKGETQTDESGEENEEGGLENEIQVPAEETEIEPQESTENQTEKILEQEENNTEAADSTEETDDAAAELKENSWRYTDGVWTPNEIMPYADYEDGATAWDEINGVFVNPYGQEIVGAKAKGIDVSEHQGKIDWEQVKNSDVDYAIIRCGYGNNSTSQDDDWWQYNVSECERLGIPYGVYIYSYATNTSMAASEAEHVLRLLQGHTLTYPVFYDLEDNSQANLGKTALGDIAETFCNKITSAGYNVGIYANLDWFNNRLTDSRFSKWDKWVAQYHPVCDYKGTYAMWQCTSTGKVPGVSGRVDINFDFKYWSNESGKWVQEGDKWYWKVGDTYKTNSWLQTGGYWYWLTEDGSRAEGWCDIAGTRYYFSEYGIMQVGFQLIDGNTYYFNSSGGMQTFWINVSGKWYYADEEGAIQTGWKSLDNKRYYFKENGELQTGWLQDPETNRWYYISESHEHGNGWSYIGSSWYYFNAKGEMQTGWLSIGVYKYYLNGSGQMLTGLQTIEGKKYYFATDGGPMQVNKWITVGGKKYYFGKDGAAVTGWQKIDGVYYYFNESGEWIENPSIAPPQD